MQKKLLQFEMEKKIYWNQPMNTLFKRWVAIKNILGKMMTKMVLKWKLVTEQTTSGNKYLKQVEMIIYTMGIMMVYTVKSKMLVV